MSENTINAALRRMGYAKDEMTGTASDQWPARYYMSTSGRMKSLSDSWRTLNATRCLLAATSLRTCL
jgi:hypothetical protein